MYAIEFGKKHKSCKSAMIWRRSLPAGTTQSEAYQVCERGDWLLWQLAKMPSAGYEKIRPKVNRALVVIISRAIRRGVKELVGVRGAESTEYRRWAKDWLSGADRSASAAWAAAAWYAAASAAAWYAAESAAWYATESAARSARSARAAARAAVRYAARDAELKLQARDIRRKIPIWKGNKS